MFQKSRDITILCKVVDNFGDIGVVYRLARALSDIFLSNQGGACPSLPSQAASQSSPAGSSASLRFVGLSATPSSGETPQRPLPFKLRIVCDNLKSFSLLEPQINPQKDFQIVNGWEIYQWESDDLCFQAFQKNQPHVILECFQCGRPDWLEKLLFEVKVPEIVNIIMIDYLTAEDYAESFHKLQSLTRSARVQKVNFMPGFSAKTGGLILDKPFMESLKKAASAEKRNSDINAVFFSYPKDWTPAVKAFQNFNGSLQEGSLKVSLAKGAGFESFYKAYTEEKAHCKDTNNFFELKELDFIPQTEWDSLLCSSDLLFIRGEDSLSRAALTGLPYVWHAYPQSEDYQLVKVQALLDAMKDYFPQKSFLVLEKCWQIYNGAQGNLQSALEAFLANYKELKEGFSSFSKMLIKNGDLAEHLLEFIESRE
ncbi:MAG: elongation factor P maturation arginine rhamnosyltransferase EarP [Treponema sp.]|nr:elongation factor P maturation arginine rhamnosyltransferase EarP [Treponema sp.]